MPARTQALHRRACGADARKHGKICTADVVGQHCPEPRERKGDRAHVAGAVFADRDVHRRPFVDGSPALSVCTATRSARPTALNAASAMWCASAPVESMWMAIRAACPRL